MEWLHPLFIAAAGFWAGTINTVVGSGTLVTFPVLVALGYPPVSASISNAMGLVAGNASGVWGYRRELRGQKRLIVRLLPASVAGGAIGAWLLLHLPSEVFGFVAPILIVVALILTIFQPRLQRWVARRRELNEPENETKQKYGTLTFLVFATGIYGGYFVAAQGILLVAIFGVLLNGALQGFNALKNVLVLCVNLVAALSYLLTAFDRIRWEVVVIIAVSSTLGGLLGARVGRRLSPRVLRTVIVVLGAIALYFLIEKLV